MKITASPQRLEREIVEWLLKKQARMGQDILRGVPVAVYEVRCAELRIVSEMLAELPAIVKKAKD